MHIDCPFPVFPGGAGRTAATGAYGRLDAAWLRRLGRIALWCVAGTVFLACLGGMALAQSAPKYLFEWGSKGTQDGQFQSVGFISASPSGEIYVLDYISEYSCKICVFDAEGNFLRSYTSSNIIDVIPNSDGSFYELYNYQNYSRIKYRDADGVEHEFTGYYYVWQGQKTNIYLVQGFCRGLDGSFYILINHGTTPRVARFNADGDFVSAWEVPISAGETFYAARIAASSEGNIYVSGRKSLSGQPYVQSMKIFSPTGEFLNEWNTSHTPTYNINTMRFAPDGTLYFTDSYSYDGEYEGHVVQHTADGTFLRSWGEKGAGPGQFRGALFGLAVNAQGRIYVGDPTGCRIQVFSDTEAPRVDRVQVLEWTPAQGTLLPPTGESTIAAQIEYELQSRDSAILELSVYRKTSSGIGRWTFTQQTVTRGTGTVNLSRTFGKNSGDEYYLAVAMLRVNDTTLLASSQWSDDYPVVRQSNANPRTLYEWPDTWTPFNSDHVNVFSLLGKTYACTTALARIGGQSYVIPLVGRFRNATTLERIDPVTEKDELTAVLQYAAMRYGDVDNWGHLNYNKAWQDRRDMMADAAERSDPKNADAGITLLASGKAFFMVGVGMVTGGTGVISQVGSILNFGQWLTDMYTNYLTDPDRGNDVLYATMATNLASPASFAESSRYTKSRMRGLVNRSVDMTRSLIEIDSAGLEAVSFLTEVTHLNPNAFTGSIKVVVDGGGLTVKHRFHGLLKLKSPHEILQASAGALGLAAVSYVVEELAEIGTYAKNMLASQQYHYNALSMLAASIAADIDRIAAITDPQELQYHLATLAVKIDMWHKCWWETVHTLKLRLDAINSRFVYGWMLKNADIAAIGAEAAKWKTESETLASKIDQASIAVSYMLDPSRFPAVSGQSVTGPIMQLLLNQ